MVRLMDLHSKKNYDYAHGGNALGNFDRVGAFFSNYPGLKLSDPVVVAAAYAMKQVDAILWAKSNGYKPEVEGLSRRADDVVVYFAIIDLLCQDEEAKASK